MDAGKTVLVFGKGGQVAQEIARSTKIVGSHFTFLGRDECDLLTNDPGEIIQSLRPSAVINAAAYTAVDRAESESDRAFRLNRDVVSTMAQACHDVDAPFVHISTDYVFDGEKTTPYDERDQRCPLSVYGASKAAGEEAIEAIGGRWTVFRTAWVFSAFGSNFIKTMLRLGSERSEVAVVADQWGRPTLAADIAEMAIEAALAGAAGEDRLSGLFHLAGKDDAVWADVAEHVFTEVERRIGKRPTLKRISTAEYPTPARRPSNSRLNTAKLQSAKWSPRPWREAVDCCLAELP